MPTEIVTIRPRCESLVQVRDKDRKRTYEHRCDIEGERYLIVGDLGTVEQNLCQKHKKEVARQYKDWKFKQLPWAVKREVREIAEVREIMEVRDEDIPF